MSLVGWLVIGLSATLVAGQFWLLYRARSAQGWPAPDFSALQPDGVTGERWLLFFHHPQCPPCREIAPLMERLAEEEPHLLRVDTGEWSELARAFRIRVTPTLMRVSDGRIDRVHVGKPSERLVRRLLGPR